MNMPSNNIASTELGPQVNFGGQMTLALDDLGQWEMRFPKAEANNTLVKIVCPGGNGLSVVDQNDSHIFQFQPLVVQTPLKLYVEGELRVGGGIKPLFGGVLNFFGATKYDFDGFVACERVEINGGIAGIDDAGAIGGVTLEVSDYIACAKVNVNGIQVVGEQQAAIPNVAGTGEELRNAFNTLLAAMRAHGLIAT